MTTVLYLFKIHIISILNRRFLASKEMGRIIQIPVGFFIDHLASATLSYWPQLLSATGLSY
jgi:hypothetical protein